MISAEEMGKLYFKKEVEREQLRVEQEAKEKIRIEEVSNCVLLKMMQRMKDELDFPMCFNDVPIPDQDVLNLALFKLRDLGYLVPNRASIYDHIDIDVPVNHK